MVQLAIEIGIDNVRAVIKKGGEYNIVPLGLIGTPYSCPPICLHTGEEYVFGEAAKINAVYKPDETIFLSDYSQKMALIEFLNFTCQRVFTIFKENVSDITFVIPPCLNHPNIHRYLNECISESGHFPIPTSDSTLSFVKSNFNVALGDKMCIIDMRDCPSYAAIVSRSQHLYSTLGCVELTDLSFKDCENFIEDKMMSCQRDNVETFDSVVIGSSLSQYGLMSLIGGKDAHIPLSFSLCDCIISHTVFADWIRPKIEKVWSHIQSLSKDLKTPLNQINQVVMLGQLFQSDYLYENLKKSFFGYGCNPKFTILSKPNDDWCMCLSSLKTYFQSSGCALQL